MASGVKQQREIGHFRVALNLTVKARLSAKLFNVKISFHSNANKTNFHVKRFAVSLAFIMRFTATRIWPIERSQRSPELELRGL